MPDSNNEIERRCRAALAAIRRAHGGAEYADSVELFVSHHLAVIGGDFWIKHCGVEHPKPDQVLEILVLQSHWGDEDEDNEDDGIDNFDFSLPGGATNYLISVSFDDNGEVGGISMEG